eukprot:TRINITY_DN5082_c0_g1_i1.p1 TRINITY_DN5082_c0_g1~~TRINITY_DN5082_c0_g1_i1.p1  ORF type:complete len:330 (-),score=109.35 TRINITY_DN5082_c0_g1_i1:555-1544(-)
MLRSLVGSEMCIRDRYKVLKYDVDGNGELDEDEMARAKAEATLFSFRASGDAKTGKQSFLGAGLKVDLMFLQGSDEVPERFLCPITDRPMTEPVNASDGATYERQAIQGVFDTQRTQCRSPVTGEKMVDWELVPNHALLEEIQQWFVQQAQQDEFTTMADVDGDGKVTEQEAESWTKRRADADDPYEGKDFYTALWSRIVEGDWVDDSDSVFRLLDRERVGSVSLDDVKAVLTDLADADHDGVIDAGELASRAESIASWDKVFRLFDVDGDNEISMQEFRQAFRRSFIAVGRGLPPPPKQWADYKEIPAWASNAVQEGKVVANGDRAWN